MKETPPPHHDLISIYAKQQRCGGDLGWLVKVPARRQLTTLLQSYCYSVSPASENTWETELIQDTIDGPWCLTWKTNTPIHCVTQLKKKNCKFVWRN